MTKATRAWSAALATGLLLAPPRPLVRELHVGSFVVRLEQTTFREAAAALGRAVQRDSGDAGGFEARTCYALAAAPDPAELELLSGEMGGGRIIEGFRLESVRPPQTCLPLSVGALEVRTERGLHLGMDRAQVERLLGGRGRDSADVVVWQRETPDSTSPGFTTLTTVTIRYGAGRVAMLEAWKVTTN